MRRNILTKHIDINKIRQNILVAKQKSNAEIMAVVKANCYNNGILIANYIEDIVCGYAVANVFEAVSLRNNGISKPILALSYHKSEYELCKKYDIAVSISSPMNYSHGLKYHIAVDTGMNRSGVKGVNSLLSLVNCMRASDIVGVYSHIYSPNKLLADSQKEKFLDAVRYVKLHNRDIVTHLFASNYVSNQENCSTDIVRLGIGLYDNALAVTTSVLQVKEVKKGESIGYDGEFIADKSMKIALCEGGYFDGVIRPFKGHKMGFNTDFCKVLGKISMDSFVIDVTDRWAKSGDQIVIYDTDNLSFEERERDLHISKYELMTALKGRFNYVYYN